MLFLVAVDLLDRGEQARRQSVVRCLHDVSFVMLPFV
jgi:hypothetical protein